MVYYNNIHKLKVGIFDSGIGGLPVYYALKQKLEMQGIADQVSIKYLGDTKNFPYGTKTREELSGIVSNNIKLLLSEGCSIIGIACNTASIVFNESAIKDVHPYIFPIVNISAQKAANLSSSGVHVISSIFTATSHAYRDLITQVNPTTVVTESGEQHLIQAIEDSDKEIIMREVKRIVNKLPENVDTFVLGCTHFYHINEIISNTLNLYNKQVSIVDPTSEMVETLYQNITKQLDFVSQPARSDVVFSGNTPSQTDID